MSLEENFENLRVTVSPGKGNKREVNSAAQEEKKIAGEVLMGKFRVSVIQPLKLPHFTTTLDYHTSVLHYSHFVQV